MEPRVMILAAGVGSGHNMAASAIEVGLAELLPGTQVKRLDILETTNQLFNRLYDDGYFQLVSDAPWLVGWGYDTAEPPFKMSSSPLQWLEDLNMLGFVRELREFDPDVVISTHFLPARVTALLVARGLLRARTSVVTTDYDFQGLWLCSPFNHFFAARAESREYMLSLGIPADRVTATGIPVRQGLDGPVDGAAIRAEFGLEPDLPVVLISAGAAGGSYALSTVRQAMRMTHRFQAVVICGRNAELKTEMDELVAGREADFKVLGFTDRMADLMRIGSLFVGKPGGLSSSECMAAGLPMVIVNPIPGQEVRNADYLLEEGAAVRCNYGTTVGYKIDQLLGDPDRLAKMAAAARRVGRPDAGRQVAEVTLATPGEPLWISRDAQKVMQEIVEQGESVLDVPEHRLRTLYDQESGASVALFTAAQLEAIGVQDWSRTVLFSREGLRSLRWHRDPLDLASGGRWLLRDQDERVFEVR